MSRNGSLYIPRYSFLSLRRIFIWLPLALQPHDRAAHHRLCASSFHGANVQKCDNKCVSDCVIIQRYSLCRHIFEVSTIFFSIFILSSCLVQSCTLTPSNQIISQRASWRNAEREKKCNSKLKCAQKVFSGSLSQLSSFCFSLSLSFH